jgi:anti-anti-sigma regulatory factor
MKKMLAMFAITAAAVACNTPAEEASVEEVVVDSVNVEYVDSTTIGTTTDLEDASAE